MTITPGKASGYVLNDEKWFDEEKQAIRCPKCESTALPLELADAGGQDKPVLVHVIPGRTIAKKGFWGSGP